MKLTEEQEKEFSVKVQGIGLILISTMLEFEIPNFITGTFIHEGQTYKLKFNKDTKIFKSNNVP